MGFFRFRRGIKLFPGVRLNLGKKGASVSLGIRGATHTVGPRGSRTTVGIPGTGLSYTSVNSGASRPGKEYTGEKRRSGCLTYCFLGVMVMLAISALHALVQGSRSESRHGVLPTRTTPGPITTPAQKPGPSPQVSNSPPAAAPQPPSALPNPTAVAAPLVSNEAKGRAIARFPSLGKANTPLNTEFMRRYHLYRQDCPSYFQNPEWPTQLAEESAKALNLKEH